MPDDPRSEISADERYFTSHEVSRIFQVTASSVIKWINDGALKAFRTPGGHRRVPASELVRFARHHGMPVPQALQELAVAKVLVVDDEPRLLRSIQRAFDPHADEFQVTTVGNGVEALILIGELKPDILMLDLQMPGLDGFEVLSRIKSSAGRRSMVVVAMSGNMDRSKAERCKKLGAAVCLEKPVHVSDLVETLRELRKPRADWSR